MIAEAGDVVGGFATVKDRVVRDTVLDVLRDICAILVNANRKRNYHMAIWRMAKALAELRDEFGKAKDFDGPYGLEQVLRYLLSEPWWPEGGSFVVRIGDGVVTSERLPDKQPTSKPKSKQPLKKRRQGAAATAKRKPRP